MISMMILERSMELPELEDLVKGRKVFIWTCNTCARLCNGMGGEDSAQRLAVRLREDGVEVTGVGSTSASCINSKLSSKKSSDIDDCDVVISLTCDTGAICARQVFCKEIIEPFRTLGAGFLDEDGRPHLKDGTSISTNSTPYI